MSTVQSLVTRAFRRLGVIDALVAPAAEDSSAALSALNEMFDGWIAQGVDVKHRQLFTSGFALTDTFWMFVPPAVCDASTVEAMSYGGTWDASANSPTLADGTGTLGTFYRVSAAGGTDLDDETGAWVVDDSLILGHINRGRQTQDQILSGSDNVWLKGRHPVGYESAVIAMLAVRLAEEYGIDPKPVLAADAVAGWKRIQAAYVIPGVPSYDRGIIYTTNRRLRWI